MSPAGIGRTAAFGFTSETGVDETGPVGSGCGGGGVDGIGPAAAAGGGGGGGGGAASWALGSDGGGAVDFAPAAA